jgi:hypothetical protein
MKKYLKKIDNNTYELIGKIAMGFYSQGIKISFDALREILNDNGAKYSYDSNLGIAKSVSAAFKMWDEAGDKVVPHAISQTFTSRDGSYAYEKYD